MIKTYFQHRMTGDEFASLLTSRESFVLESVGDMAGAVKVCQSTLISLGLSCRVVDRRSSFVDDAVIFLPLPLRFLVAAWKIAKAIFHWCLIPNPAVLVVMMPQALHIKFRKGG
ncbi:hypothetical protein [Bordetella sp. LUAb4]|uniref:hypothetical protein n=1 Tax=Bordetella sp. LUAb4 TaxID=2843195 RepID=UPI001E5FF577|nr:hypothetical protein [Bordetella sp. LUAb4]